MQTQNLSRSVFTTIALTASVILSSCSLPPGEAWRQIQRDGLIPFIANGMSAPKAQLGTEPGQMLATKTATPKVLEPSRPQVQPVTTSPAKGAIPDAYAVSGLYGYVRSPHTNPPRLVDVRDMNAGATVVCPYTQQPFIVPVAAIKPRPAAQLATTTPAPAKVSPAPTPQPKPQPQLQVKPEPKPVAPAMATAPPQPKAQAPQKSPAPAKPQPAPTVAANTPPSTPKPTPAPAPAKVEPKIEPKTAPSPPPQTAAAPKLPFGSPIPGRPGFVNSPFAERHQLVDVTGLTVGTEVKCPYTGKLFRVPPQEQAKR
jgi:hypothetical protein